MADTGWVVRDVPYFGPLGTTWVKELRDLAEYAGELAFQRDQALRVAREALWQLSPSYCTDYEAIKGRLVALEMEAGLLCSRGQCMDCHRCDELEEK